MVTSKLLSPLRKAIFQTRYLLLDMTEVLPKERFSDLYVAGALLHDDRLYFSRPVCFDWDRPFRPYSLNENIGESNEK